MTERPSAAWRRCGGAASREVVVVQSLPGIADAKGRLSVVLPTVGRLLRHGCSIPRGRPTQFNRPPPPRFSLAWAWLFDAITGFSVAAPGYGKRAVRRFSRCGFTSLLLGDVTLEFIFVRPRAGRPRAGALCHQRDPLPPLGRCPRAARVQPGGDRGRRRGDRGEPAAEDQRCAPQVHREVQQRAGCPQCGDPPRTTRRSAPAMGREDQRVAGRSSPGSPGRRSTGRG